MPPTSDPSWQAAQGLRPSTHVSEGPHAFAGLRYPDTLKEERPADKRLAAISLTRLGTWKERVNVPSGPGHPAQARALHQVYTTVGRPAQQLMAGIQSWPPALGPAGAPPSTAIAE